MKLSILIRILIGIVLTSALFLIMFFSYFNSMKVSFDSSEQVEESQKVISKILEIGYLVSVAEKSERGYIITGNEDYYKNFIRIKKELPDQLQELRGMLKNHYYLQEDAGNLTEYSSLILKVYESNIQLEKNGEHKKIVQVLNKQDNWIVSKNFWTLINNMKEKEQYHLAQLFQKSKKEISKTFILAIVASSFFFLIFLYGSYRIYSGVRKSQKLMRELYKAKLMLSTNNSLLEQKVEERSVAIIQQNKELQRINKILDDFIYTAAHDLKAPISNLIMLLKLMNSEKDCGKKEELLKLINTSVHRLDITLISLVKLMELQNNSQNEGNWINLERLFNSLLKGIKKNNNTKSIKINTNFDSAPTISYNENFLSIIFENLLSNSIKFSDPTKDIKIEVSSQIEGSYTVITFKDNGIGMNLPRYGKHLFKPFIQFHKEKSGAGIGLYFIKNIVEKNGGKIEVESQENKGTIFKIYLMPYIVEEKVMTV